MPSSSQTVLHSWPLYVFWKLKSGFCYSPEEVAALAGNFWSRALLLTVVTGLMLALLGFPSGEEIGDKGCIVSGLMPLSINSSLEKVLAGTFLM